MPSWGERRSPLKRKRKDNLNIAKNPNSYYIEEVRIGEVVEWFMAPLSKSGIPARYRGFESLPLRQNSNFEPMKIKVFEL